jgi:hypothetical protein
MDVCGCRSCTYWYGFSWSERCWQCSSRRGTCPTTHKHVPTLSTLGSILRTETAPCFMHTHTRPRTLCFPRTPCAYHAPCRGRQGGTPVELWAPVVVYILVSFLVASSFLCIGRLASSSISVHAAEHHLSAYPVPMPAGDNASDRFSGLGCRMEMRQCNRRAVPRNSIPIRL